MLKYEEIQHLHLEFSSFCNARCPLCPRNLYGFPYNRGYEETNLTLELIKKSFSPQFIAQLNKILVNGNFGDFTANLESLDIIKYFSECNPNLFIEISTNGSARNADFWANLGKIPNTFIEFCLDGLEDTHHLYRQDTDFSKIIKNAQTFIANGGIAIWKMIKFDHNQHQIEEAERRSKEYGFYSFKLEDHGRNAGPVFDRQGKLVHVMGNWEGDTDIEKIIEFNNDSNKQYRHPNLTPDKKISCYTKKFKSVYIAADGRVYPCCFIGFSPLSYNKGWHGFVNRQIAPLIYNNNLHENSLEEAIKWLYQVESSWSKQTKEEGRLMQCDFTCSKS